MPEGDPGPIFDRLFNTGHDPSDGTIALQLGTDAHTAMQINLTHDIVGGLVTALANEMMQLLPKMGEDARAAMSPFTGQGIRASVMDDGRPVLLIDITGHLVMPIALPQADLHKFAAELYEMTAPAPSAQN